MAMSNVLDAGVVRKRSIKAYQEVILNFYPTASLPHLVRRRGPQHSPRCSQRSSGCAIFDHMADAPTRRRVPLSASGQL
jgi:hypothetical protein